MGQRVTLNGAVNFAHLLLKEYVQQGDAVVDATCGNGNDTLLLARLVGPGGRVWAFDVQDEAIAATRTRLEGATVLDRVELLHAGHETIGDVVPEGVRLVIFNLGYLPGSDKSVITRPETTVRAVQEAARLVVAGGAVVVVVYPGHPGGAEEALAVEKWVAGLDSRFWYVWRCSRLNRKANAPHIILVEKNCVLPPISG